MTLNHPTAIAVFGPTASGKTGLGIDLANYYNGEIINADSRQIYQQIDIISAMPSAAEFTIAPHHLFQFLSPEKRYSAAAYQAAARTQAEDILAQNKTPIFVGGTGLYLKSLIEGINYIPNIPTAIETALEARISQEGSAALHAELAAVDSTAASKIHATDKQRIIRALAVFQHTQKPISAWQSEPRVGALDVNWIKIGINPPRDVLHQRLEQRMVIMLEEGMLQEVRALYDAGLPPTLPALTGLGIAEIYQYFAGEITQAEALNAMLIDTRQYARRQITWLNNTFAPDFVVEKAADALPLVAKSIKNNT